MDEQTLVDLISPVLEAHRLELDSLDIIPAGKRKVLRITVDGEGPKGRGPLLDQISRATRDISEALDASDSVGNNPYTLEVSSRGVGKPLLEPKHYRRNIGRLVAVNLVDGSQVTGRLTEADDEQLTVVVEPEPGKRLPKGLDPVNTIAIAEVTKAVVKVEMNRKHDPELDDLGDESEDDDDDFIEDEESEGEGSEDEESEGEESEDESKNENEEN